MNMTKVRLVRNGRHMRPMLAVLTRNDIGVVDKYNRGRWISDADLPRIKSAMLTDPTRVVDPRDVFVAGTNQHNHVGFADFTRLFEEES